MPIYEFRCKDCGETFDKLVSMSYEQTDIKCPHCGSIKVKKMLSTFATKEASASSGASCAPSGGG